MILNEISNLIEEGFLGTAWKHTNAAPGKIKEWHYQLGKAFHPGEKVTDHSGTEVLMTDEVRRLKKEIAGETNVAKKTDLNAKLTAIRIQGNRTVQQGETKYQEQRKKQRFAANSILGGTAGLAGLGYVGSKLGGEDSPGVGSVIVPAVAAGALGTGAYGLYKLNKKKEVD